MQIRNAREEDYAPIIAVIDDWWGGRHMADMLPKLFFQHFQNTSFVVEEEDQIIAFLVGLISQTDPRQAYIHFVGVHPEHRKHGLAKELYERFYATVRERGCTEVHSVTSPGNKGSVAFHTRMGFDIEPGDAEVYGIPVKTDYDGRGQSRVRFVLKLAALEPAQRSHMETTVAQTPEPPYYAVMFTSFRTDGDNGYGEMADEMVERAQQQVGFLGVESAREPNGMGVTVSYWESEDAIRTWRENARHRTAQKLGREGWYERFVTRVSKVERAYRFER